MTYTATLYEKCRDCHLFIERNSSVMPRWWHLTRGDEADEAIEATHDAMPSGEVHALAYWKEFGPDEMKARFDV